MTDTVTIRRELLERLAAECEAETEWNCANVPAGTRAATTRAIAMKDAAESIRAALAAPVQGEAVAWARQCDLDESDPAIFVAREEVQESGYLVPLYTTPQPAPAQDVAGLLEWAVDRWHAEVANRPLQNVHRRSLDDTWRQVIRKLGGDAGLLCGPAHDALAAHDKQSSEA